MNSEQKTIDKDETELQKEEQRDEIDQQDKRDEEFYGLDVEEGGVTFDAEVTSFKLEDGVAMFELRPDGSERTYVSTMEATVDLGGQSEFEQFLEENGIEENSRAFEDLPIPCQAVARREEDIIKFEIESIEIGEEQEQVTFEELSSCALGAIAGIAPLANIMLFFVMMGHSLSKDSIQDTDVMFLFGMMVTMVTTLVLALPIIA